MSKDNRVFRINSRWAYGKHGIGRVTEVSRKEVALYLPSCNAMVRLSLQRAIQHLRKPIDAKGARQIIGILRAPSGPPPLEAWVRRMRNYQEKMRYGLPEDLAEIYRDLGRKPLMTYSEKRLFSEIGTLLLTELGRVLPDAERRIKEAVGAVQ